MNRTITLLAFAAFLSAGAAPAVFCAGELDKYRSFTDLKSKKTEGTDFKVEVADRHNPVTAFVIHGGTIEPVAEVMARECAGTDYNLYAFSEITGESHREYHVTARRFDDPRLVALSTGAVITLGFHQQRDKNDHVCLGGSNRELRDDIAEALGRGGFNAENPCRRFPAVDATNPANMGLRGGVQFELSRQLSSRLEQDSELRSRFCAAVRGAVGEYLAKGK